MTVPVTPEGQPPKPDTAPAGDTPPAYNTDPATAAILAALIGGGSSSGGSSGGGAAPVDPTIGAASSFYFQLWGIKPPAGYVEGKIAGGFDLFDFMAEQLARPGAAKQTFFRDKYAQYAGALASRLGTR